MELIFSHDIPGGKVLNNSNVQSLSQGGVVFVRTAVQGTSLAVEWLGFCNFTAEGTVSVPAQGTKILQTAQDDKYICI